MTRQKQSVTAVVSRDYKPMLDCCVEALVLLLKKRTAAGSGGEGRSGPQGRDRGSTEMESV